MFNKYNKKILYILILICIMLTACTNRNRIMAYRAEGINSLQNQNYQEALDYFNMAISAGDGEVTKLQYDLLLYKAECLFQLGDFSKSRDIYNVLLKVNPNNSQFKEIFSIISSLASLDELRAALDNNNLTEAEELINKLKQTGLEHDRAVIFNQGVLYEKKGEWKYALDQFKYYLTQFPNDEKALHEIEFINAQLR